MTWQADRRKKGRMARFTPLTLQQAEPLGAFFGVSIAEVCPLDAGSVNSNFRLRTTDGELLFGRIYEEQDAAGARVELRLLQELSALDIPSTQPVGTDSQGCALLTQHLGKPFALYRWIAGEDLCLQRVSTDHLVELGTVLARMHLASERLSRLPAGRFGVEAIGSRLLKIEAAAPALSPSVALIREKLAEYTARRLSQTPQGAIHGDLFRDNVLWHDGKIAALLDFESACTGPFVYDLMVCVLAWCFTDSFERGRVAALLGAYHQVRPLSKLEREQLPVEGAIACLRFATTRISDFELRVQPGQVPGRDFRRFLKRLEELEAGAVDFFAAPKLV